MSWDPNVALIVYAPIDVIARAYEQTKNVKQTGSAYNELISSIFSKMSDPEDFSLSEFYISENPLPKSRYIYPTKPAYIGGFDSIQVRWSYYIQVLQGNWVDRQPLALRQPVNFYMNVLLERKRKLYEIKFDILPILRELERAYKLNSLDEQQLVKLCKQVIELDLAVEETLKGFEKVFSGESKPILDIFLKANQYISEMFFLLKFKDVAIDLIGSRKVCMLDRFDAPSHPWMFQGSK